MAPPSKLIIRTLRELSYNHTKGILILVSGCAGNSFNFGLAMERAKNDNIKLQLIQVKDCQNLNSHLAETGSTGVALLSKIAGAMSEEGKNLSEIYNCCECLSKNMVTVGVRSKHENNSDSYKTCKRILCKDADQRVVDTYISESVCLNQVEDIINLVPDDTFQQEEGKLNLKHDESVVLLINNNGSLKKVNEFNLVKQLIQFLSVSLINIKRIYLGNFLSSSDVAITIMKVDRQEILDYLDAPCNAPGKKISMIICVIVIVSFSDQAHTSHHRFFQII